MQASRRPTNHLHLHPIDVPAISIDKKHQKIISSNEVGLGKVEPWWISGGVEECIAKAEEIADAKFDAAAYAKRHAAWMSTKIDCTAFLTWFIEEYPESAEKTRKADVEFWERFR